MTRRSGHSSRAGAAALLLAAIGAAGHIAQAQNREPRVGYAIPAGAQRGTTIEVTVGGQYLEGTQGATVSGSGVRATLLKFNRPLPMKRANEFRDYIDDTRKRMNEAKAPPAEIRKLERNDRITVLLKEAGATDDEIKSFFEIRAQRNDPKRQQNVQLSEKLVLKVEVAPDAPVGMKELRLLSPGGVSNPVSFAIGSLAEQTGIGQTGTTAASAARVTLPVVLNGWIPPGGVDHYSFQTRRGAHLVIAVQARDLIPYLADAVPGWFQPVIALYDSNGREVAYGDHFRFSPDPVICCDILQDGVYTLEIRDALYRGREDFIYRATVGEIPYVTGIYPLGGRPGFPIPVELGGWNLRRKKITVSPAAEGVVALPELGNEFVKAGTVFATDGLPQIMEHEPNDKPEEAQRITPPMIINGRIDSPGDVDVYSVSCQAGETIALETYARRLNSPLDTWLKVTDSAGHLIAYNDDFEDKGSGLLTHSADSRLEFTATNRGIYYVSIGDTQGNGGEEYAYRLRISQPMLDFALRIVPSCVSARPGTIIPVMIYALRKDGFNDDIIVNLKDAPPGYQLDGGWIPAGQDKVRATLTLPPDAPAGSATPPPGKPGASPSATPRNTPRSSPTGTPLLNALRTTPTPTPTVTPARTPTSTPTVTPPGIPPKPTVTPPGIPKPNPTASPSATPMRGPAGNPSVSPSPAPTVTGTAAIPTPTPAMRLAPTPSPTPAYVPPVGSPVILTLEGQASIHVRPIVRPVVPADDRTQAFVYHHLVPAKDFLVLVTGAGRGRPPVKIVTHTPVKLPAGGSTKIVLALSVPGGARAPFPMPDTKFKLNDPPDGIGIEDVAATAEGLVLTLKTDPAKAKPGLKGNLNVDAYTEYAPPPGKDGKVGDKKRNPAGILPAIAFEVVTP